MADSGYKRPSNSTVVNADNLHVQTMKVENATNMYAGRLVMKGTADDDAVVNTGEGTAIGWIGYEQTDKNNRPATSTTIFVINKQIAIINGPGIVLLASLAAEQTAVKGAMLVATAAGELSAWSAGHTPVCIAEETISAASSNSLPIMVRSLI